MRSIESDLHSLCKPRLEGLHANWTPFASITMGTVNSINGPGIWFINA